MPGRKSLPKGDSAGSDLLETQTQRQSHISAQKRAWGKMSEWEEPSYIWQWIFSPNYLKWVSPLVSQIVIIYKKKKKTSMKSYTSEYLQVTPFTIKLHRSRKSIHWETCAITSISTLVLVLGFFNKVWSMSTKNGSLSILKLMEETKV